MHRATHLSDAAGSIDGSCDVAVFVNDATSPATIVSGPPDLPVGPPGRVLVVDDDAKCLRILRAYLVPEGYEVIEAGSAEEALVLARRENPDVMIVDALMPILSGYDVCRILKRDPVTRLLPIVLVSSLDERDDRMRGIDVGADDFLTRPLDRLEIVVRVRALVRQKRGTDMLEDAEAVIFALARAVEGRDAALRDHADRVVTYAVRLGRALGLSSQQLNSLRRAAIVHDLGKISIPDSILLKPGKLTPDEWKIVRQHPEVAYRLLQPLRTFGDVLEAVRFHHERLDGSGYPLGLRGASVPQLAQILAIADVFDALTGNRCYREPMKCEDAVAVLREEALRGLHDCRLVETFVRQVVPDLQQRQALSHCPV